MRWVEHASLQLRRSIARWYCPVLLVRHPIPTSRRYLRPMDRRPTLWSHERKETLMKSLAQLAHQVIFRAGTITALAMVLLAIPSTSTAAAPEDHGAAIRPFQVHVP